MASRTVRVGVNPELLSPGLAVLRVVTLEIQAGNELWVPYVGRRIPMAVQAPFHGHWLYLGNHFHLVDATVAGNAADAAINMG